MNLYNPFICWPRDLVYVGDVFVGYVMDEVKGAETLLSLRLQSFSEYTHPERFEICYCNKCGQNNEYYVERKPIEKVEIYHQPSSSNPGYSQPQTTYQQTNIYQQTTVQPVKQESGALGVCAIIFSVLGGWLGLVLSIIGLCTYKTPEHRTKCKIGLGFVIGWFVIGLLIGLASL